MIFRTLKEETFNLDFVKDVLKNTNQRYRDRYLEIFNSSGLLTEKMSLGNFGEDFARFLLHADFKICTRHFKYQNYVEHKYIELEEKLDLECSHKCEEILCNMLKRKYEFMQDDRHIQHIRTIKKNGKTFYTFFSCGYLFFYPQDELEKSDEGRRLSQLIDTGGFFGSLDLLTPNEKDEYEKKCKGIQECIDYETLRNENVWRGYHRILLKNNITLSIEDLQFLKECLLPYGTPFDFFGIRRRKSSFSEPFYFIEVKSRKLSHLGLSPNQRKFMEKVKGKFGILILHIKIEPQGVRVKYLLPK